MNGTLFAALGFSWRREDVAADVPTYSVERACFRFHKMLAQFVWDASRLQGNPLTFPEVKTILDGVAVEGRPLSDQCQVVNLAEGSKRLLEMVRDGTFAMTKTVACELHGIVARKEAFEWGHFRGEGIETHGMQGARFEVAGGFAPLPSPPDVLELNRTFERGIAALSAGVESAYERGCAYFLFGALQQFFFNGNKRTARFMMNGILMTAGIDAISIPAARAGEFDEKLASFFQAKDASEMMAMLWSCHPASKAAKQLP